MMVSPVIRRPRDQNTMFVVNYESGETAYITISPWKLRHGDHVARGAAEERQAKGEIPKGKIATVKRVR
jgi:hypothetical protein